MEEKTNNSIFILNEHGIKIIYIYLLTASIAIIAVWEKLYKKETKTWQGQICYLNFLC